MNHGRTDAPVQVLPEMPFDLREGMAVSAPLGRTDVPVIVLPELALEPRTAPESFSVVELAQACRIFMDLAYPEGASTIPDSKRGYYEIGADHPLDELLPPGKTALGVCQQMPRRPGAALGYAFRLGSAAYPHLKLCVQPIPYHDRAVWVYSVDTHDGGPQLAKLIAGDDAKAWRAIVDQNRELKRKIESALSAAGFLTPNNLLQLDLAAPAAPI